MKRAVAAAVLLAFATSGAAAPPEAEKGERPAKEGKVAEKPEKPNELHSSSSRYSDLAPEHFQECSILTT